VLHDYGFTNEKAFKTVVEKMSEGFRMESNRSPRDTIVRK
jgi:hypothetical protein